jgi:hypothetical protein
MTKYESASSLTRFKVAKLQTLRYLIEQPRIKQNLKDIVDDQNPLKIHRFPAGHHPGTKHFPKVDVAETDGNRREWTAHRDPVFHTRICK